MDPLPKPHKHKRFQVNTVIDLRLSPANIPVSAWIPLLLKRWLTAGSQETRSSLSDMKAMSKVRSPSHEMKSVSCSSSTCEREADQDLSDVQRNGMGWYFLLCMLNHAKKHGMVTALTNPDMLPFLSHYGIPFREATDLEDCGYLIATLDKQLAHTIFKTIKADVELARQLDNSRHLYWFIGNVTRASIDYENGLLLKLRGPISDDPVHGRIVRSSAGSQLYTFTPKTNGFIPELTQKELDQIGNPFFIGRNARDQNQGRVFSIRTTSTESIIEVVKRVWDMIARHQCNSNRIIIEFSDHEHKHATCVYINWINQTKGTNGVKGKGIAITPDRSNISYGLYPILITPSTHNSHIIDPFGMAEWLVDFSWALTGDKKAKALTGLEKRMYIAQRVKAAVSPLGDIISWDALTKSLPVKTQLIISALKERVCLQTTIDTRGLTDKYKIENCRNPRKSVSTLIQRNIDLTYVSIPFPDMHAYAIRNWEVIHDAEFAIQDLVNPF